MTLRKSANESLHALHATLMKTIDVSMVHIDWKALIVLINFINCKAQGQLIN